MTPTIPQVQPLPRAHRRFVFLFSVLLFVVLVPLLVFYAVGYRFDFVDGDLRNIMSVGGMYINTDADGVSIYIDNAPVEDLRIFQRASYIQNLEAGMHRIHTQGSGVQTWVKELPVFAHFVTEASSFNMPVVPQVRHITEFQTPTGAYVVTATNTNAFLKASSTQSFFVASSSRLATSTLLENPEYTYVKNLFASTTEDRAILKRNAGQSIDRFALTAIEKKKLPATTTATSSVLFHDMELAERDGEVMADWQGDKENIPYYFCVDKIGTSTKAMYGAHIAAQLMAAASSTSISTTGLPAVFEEPDRLCRTNIRIDRKGQEVLWFAFVPDDRNHVLMHLQDGIYVVEIDDRAWQNTQLLYPGTDLMMLVEGGKILVKDGDTYLEVYTEIQN